MHKDTVGLLRVCHSSFAARRRTRKDLMGASFQGGAWRWWAIVGGIVALSPLPLTIPSGWALAVIGLLGAIGLVRPTQPPMTAGARSSRAARSGRQFRPGPTR